ncbi:MAG: UDP-N-acetylmuramate--L-alanine ligase [Marinilabiliales bacterium]
MHSDLLKNIYLIGIGGIGMSALAKYFLSKGCYVAGYDKTRSSITNDLIKAGIYICFDEEINLIPENIINHPDDTLIIYTPAVPTNHKQLIYFKENNFQVLKRAEVLGNIVKDFKTVAVAGTHGKTTITALISYIFKTAGIKHCAFIGGIAKNYNSNILIDEKPEIMVVEADEYDKSFLNLYPDTGIITYMDRDHLDVYGKEEGMIKTYLEFISNIKENGNLVFNDKLNLEVELQDLKKYKYSLNNEAGFFLKKVSIDNNRYVLDLYCNGQDINNVKLGFPGKFNIENALAAIAVAVIYGVQPNVIRTAMNSFKGIKRRFDIKYDNKVLYIDDYAHHPRAINALIESVRELYPGRIITGIFQPHLYSRTRDLADEFINSLNNLDELILTDIYPARELPIEGITSKILFDKVNCRKKAMCKKEDIINKLKEFSNDIIITIGAGDIELESEKIVKYLKENYG